MFEKFMKLKKPLAVCVVILMLIVFARSFTVEPLTHKIAPSTIQVEDMEWESCVQLADDTWDYSCQLPSMIKTDDIVSIVTSWVSARVYVDNRCIFIFDDTYKDKGTCRHWIRLPLWAAGGTLHVVYSGEQRMVETSAKQHAYYGNAAFVYLTFVSDKAYAFVFAVCVCLMLILIIYFYRLMRRQMDGGLKHSLWYLGMFMLTTGIWIVCDSQILFTVTRNAAGNTLASYCGLILFPMFLLMFVSEMADHRIKVLDALTPLYLLDFLFILGGYATHAMPLNHSLVSLHILVVVSIATIIFFGIRDVRIHNNKDMKKILGGFVGLACCGIAAIVMYYILPAMNYSFLYCIGLLIFMFCVIWAAYERLYRVMGHNANILAYRRLAYRDVLTDLGNRAAFMKEQQALSPEAPVGFIVMDINDLKHTNDCFGHQAGDELICSAAECISQVFKGKGNAYRIGGDEFVVIVKDATEEYLQQLLRRLEEAQEKKRKDMKKPWKLQIAYGYALHQAGESYDDLFRQTDDRMYECKRRMKEQEQTQQ